MLRRRVLPLCFSAPLSKVPRCNKGLYAMEHNVQPYRSVLYMPGSRPRALEQARALPADALILDLEDAVAPAEKPRSVALAWW